MYFEHAGNSGLQLRLQMQCKPDTMPSSLRELLQRYFVMLRDRTLLAVSKI